MDVTNSKFFIIFGNMAKQILDASKDTDITVDLSLNDGRTISINIKENLNDKEGNEHD